MIIILDGADAEAKRLLGNSLRNAQISAGKGALLIHADCDGDPVHLLEKIIVAHRLEPDMDIRQIHWKPDPAIIVASEREAMLEVFEAMVPGFMDRFGPISRAKGGTTERGFWSKMFG